MANQVIHLDVKLTNSIAEVRLNDIPLARYDGNQQDYKSLPVPRYLIDGVNTLEVIINPGPMPRTFRNEYEQATSATGVAIDAKLVRYPEGVYSGDPSGVVLTQLAWSGRAESTKWPRILKSETDIGVQSGRWRWQDADVLTPPEVESKEVFALVEALHAAMSKGESERAFQLSRIRFEEAYRAYPASNPSDMGRDFRLAISKRFKEGTWELRPLDPKDYNFRLVARGKMIQCIYKDWKPVIQAKPVGQYREYLLPVFISRLEKTFRIVR